jgi:FkbM family methyltransferase
MGARRVISIEAHPEVYKRLEQKAGGQAGVMLANVAVGDRIGRVPFHTMASDQEGSILPAGAPGEMSAAPVETGTREVNGITIDRLLVDTGQNPAQFNVLSLDVGGAELPALRGAAATLNSIEAVHCRVHFEQVYDGVAEIEELEGFLWGLGFTRAGLTSPVHRSWGEGLYVRTRRVEPAEPPVHPEWL